MVSMKVIASLFALLATFECAAGLMLQGEEIWPGTDSAWKKPLAVPENTDAGAGAQTGDETKSLASPEVIVYYFHGYARCWTCRRIESLAHFALEQEFPVELKSGRLQWQAVNIEEDCNAHFVDDYQLFSRALIVQKLRDDKQADWKNLNRIWELIGDEMVFVDYVQEEVATILGKAQ